MLSMQSNHTKQLNYRESKEEVLDQAMKRNSLLCSTRSQAAPTCPYSRLKKAFTAGQWVGFNRASPLVFFGVQCNGQETALKRSDLPQGTNFIFLIYPMSL